MLHAQSDQFTVEPPSSEEHRYAEVRSDLRERVEQRLAELGKSCRGASIEAGLSDSALRNLIEGKVGSPTLRTVVALGRVLQVDPLWFTDEHGLVDEALPSPSPPPPSLAFFPGLRFFQVPDDHLEPTVHRLDYVLIAPVAGYRGEGYYLVENGLGEPAGFYCSGAGKVGAPLVRLRCLNPHYSDDHVSLDDFAKSVVGKIVLTCKVQDPALLRAHLPA